MRQVPFQALFNYIQKQPFVNIFLEASIITVGSKMSWDNLKLTHNQRKEQWDLESGFDTLNRIYHI